MRSTSLFCALTLCTLILPTKPSCAFEDHVQSQPARVTEAVGVKPADVSPSEADISTVIAAIEAEANGDLATRSKLLAAAIELGNLTPARWQAGQISLDGKRWTSIEESVAVANDQQVVAKIQPEKSWLSRQRRV